MARLNYVELPTSDIAAAQRFYEQAFGWTLADFGPSYAATTTGDTDIGLQADTAEATRAPLPVIDVADLEAVRDAVLAAGGVIVRPIFFSGRTALPFRRSERQRARCREAGLRSALHLSRGRGP